MDVIKRKINNFIKDVEQSEIPRTERKIKAVESTLLEEENFNLHRILEIKERNERLKKDLDDITEHLLETLGDFFKENSDILKNHTQQLTNRKKKLNALLRESKKVLQSGNEFQMSKFSNDIPSHINDIFAPPLPSANFTAGRTDIPQLKHMLGELKINKPNCDLNENPDIQDDLETAASSWNSTSTLFPYTKRKVTSLHRADDDLVWLCSEGDSVLVSVDNNLDRVKYSISVGVKDISISLRTGHIWILSTDNNTVKEVQVPQKQIVHRFTTGCSPMSICMASNDHVVIGHDHQIVMYTQSGQVVCKTSGGSLSAVWSPVRIAECPATKHLAVADNSKIGVYVFNDSLVLLYSYTGERLFRPYDVCFTNTGQLVVTDYNNGTVLKLSDQGEFLQTLFTHNVRPLAVCVKSDRCVYVSFEDNSVHIVRDLQQY